MKPQLIAGAVAACVATVTFGGDRLYYISKKRGQGGTAAQLCDPGYHLASIFEVEQPSALRYNTKLGFVAPDSGSGPPVGNQAWARWGGGGANNSCNGWTTSDPAVFGTVYMIIIRYSNQPDKRPMYGPWVQDLVPCNGSAPAICIQD